ncbi:uroporphyrinogen-III synthase [Noviherbaspirillum galbum]|uniref:Uroporphyrinogen-III synthase n=1 Tax=Noviherbaspirillum galbum TaxID=2709383 RepID=A0A6B3SLA6_9BURK|nr:uroporphyrinogen-III synthase [Noviherbaspirillum galbum]NEX61550.1 uroporphyrinogen III synthase [Noviherbaspirillum galbum]
MANSGSPPVIITRPLAQAEALAGRVRACGRMPVLFPLLDIQPLPDQAALRARLAALDQYALAVFVSPNAIDAAIAAMPGWPGAMPRGVPLAVMGEGSRAALAAHGITADGFTIFSPTDRQRTDSETLLPELDLPALRGRRVLLVRGESGRELLADALRAEGIEVEPVAAYRRAAPVLDDAGKALLRRLLDEGGEWVITSSEALRNLRDSVVDVLGEGGVAKMQRQALIVPHARIADTARALGFTSILQTASGDEGVVAALQSRA